MGQEDFSITLEMIQRKNHTYTVSCRMQLWFNLSFRHSGKRFIERIRNRLSWVRRKRFWILRRLADLPRMTCRVTPTYTMTYALSFRTPIRSGWEVFVIINKRDFSQKPRNDKLNQAPVRMSCFLKIFYLPRCRLLVEATHGEYQNLIE